MGEQHESSQDISGSLANRAQSVLPGGDTRSVTYYQPYPAFVESASGPTFETVDGETMLDFLNNYTQSVLGHAPDPVVEAMCTRLQQGNNVAAPNRDIVRLAEQLVERTPSIESVRFGNSGTEATMNAIRAAMAWTGNERILKIDGGYHGTHDTAEVAVGDEGADVGIPADVSNRVDAVPFNDLEALKTAFENNGSEYACFILEPILGVGGMIPATDAYLEAARDLTTATETVLVFDEVMSYRLATGGAQTQYGIQPDLTALGKLIGGGLPVGAFGGRTEIMEQFHPVHGSLKHSGTFNGNPATMAGGVATLEILDEETIQDLNGAGDELRTQLQAIGNESDHAITITGSGSLFQIHFTEGAVTDVEASTAGNPLTEQLFHEMRSHGVFIAPRGMGNLSTPMTEDDIETFTSVFERSLSALEAH